MTLSPDEIVPDDKDWTWVLQRPCDECGFDAAAVPAKSVAASLADNAARWTEVLLRADVSMRRRSDRWSHLEYACHVRDVFRLYDYRLKLMLDQDGPSFPNWNPDDTAAAENYRSQDPSIVADELLAAQRALSATFASVAEDRWERTGFRSDGAAFTIDTFARYLLHDPVHHLVDVAQ